MSDSWDFGWQGNKEVYTPGQVAATIKSCGVEIVGETNNDYLCFCPFHGNTHTPSFSVSRTNGAYICFNHSCGLSGTLTDLVKKIPRKDGTFLNEFEARRLILKKKGETQVDVLTQIQEILSSKPEFVEFPNETIDRMYNAFWSYPEVVRYMVEERGFEEETLDYFKIGYSSVKDIIAVPMHDPDGMPIGVIGRPANPESRAFKNSKNLPVSKTLWNFHRAKRHGDTVIITEASFDGMRVHQAGYPNVVATLGGNFSPFHFDLIDRTFSKIVIMTDFDDKKKYVYQNCAKCKKRKINLCVGHNPGRDLGVTIAAGLQRKQIFWASMQDGMVYPDGAKDPGEMTDNQIRQCLKNAVPNLIYAGWNLY